MNQRNMFVADSLNVVFTETVFQHRWAFKRFNSHNLCAVDVFQSVASSNGASGTCCRSKRGQSNV